MYLRRCYKVKDGKRHAYWALVESERTARGPRQRVVAYLGDLDQQAARESAAGLRPGGGVLEGVLFDETHPQWVMIDAARMEVTDCKHLGGPVLGLDLMRRLGLMEFFGRAMPGGREDVPWSAMAAMLVLCRLLNPSSELHIAEHAYERSALSDLLGVPAAKVNDDRLFRIHKSDLSLRPIWHQKEGRVQAHILVCFLAYVLWKTLGQLCRRAGLGDEPRKVLDELAQVQVIGVTVPTRKADGSDGPLLHKRCVSRPTDHSGDPAAPPGPAPAQKDENHEPAPRRFNGNVVKTFREPPLIAKHLRQQLRKLG